MCRETKREPAWVAAIRLALLRGRVTVDDVVEEANLVAGRERTVCDVLETMHERELLSLPPGRESDPDADPTDRVYLPGRVLVESDRFDLDFSKASDGGAHRWASP